MTHSEARKRVLNAAERLFSQKGFTAVTLRDIAKEIGINHTSLYHHVPDGKEALYMEVTTRHFARHERALTEIIAQSGDDLQSQLRGAAEWLLSQPPVDSIRLVNVDMPVLEPRHAEQLTDLAERALLNPIRSALEDAQARGKIGEHDMVLVAGGILGMIESLHAVPAFGVEKTRLQMSHELLDIFLEGLLKR